MFTWLVDGLLLFTVTTPVIGRLARYTRWKPLVELYALAGFVVAIYFLATLSLRVQAEGVVVLAVGPPGTPVGVHLVVDPLSVFMSGIFVAVGFIAILFSGRYMQHDTGRPVYYALILGITTGMVGVVEAGDLFTLFVFWEVMVLCSYALVAFRKASWEPVEAGYKYLIMSAAGGVTALFAMSLLYGMTGTLNLAALARALGNASGGQWMYLSLTMIIAGFGLQAGMAPLHAWLPDAHSAAPAPVSAILSGAMVMTGVYGLLRLLPLVFLPLQGAWTLTLAVFAVASMFTGNLMALLQDDVKRLLAYSTIANVGYILLGLASQTIAGVTGSLFQMLNHAVVKALLFLCSGAYLHQVKTRNLRDLGGIGRRMPLTSAVWPTSRLPRRTACGWCRRCCSKRRRSGATRRKRLRACSCPWCSSRWPVSSSACIRPSSTRWRSGRLTRCWRFRPTSRRSSGRSARRSGDPTQSGRGGHGSTTPSRALRPSDEAAVRRGLICAL
jgi:proton-translocating NADH-quinone oxidoreductase chain N